MTEDPRDRARKYAALSGPFAPQAALQAAFRGGGPMDGPDSMIAISADLASVCDPAPGRWLMRSSERQKLLAELDDGALYAAIAWRRAQPDVDAESSDLLAAIEGSGSFAPDALQATLQSRSDVDGARLQRAAAAIGCAGPVAKAFLQLPEIRAAIARGDQARRGEVLLQYNTVGREDERRQIADWIEARAPPGPVRALFVTGQPAIGKSTLLETALQDIAARRIDCVVIRMDFDRHGLDVRDLAGLTSDVGRQVAAQRPQSAAALRQARLDASVNLAGPALKGTTPNVAPKALIAAIAEAIATQPGIVLFVLDTMEALVSRGAAHPAQLFAWLDALREGGVAPMAVVAAGRGDVQEVLGERSAGEPITLSTLTRPEEDRLLESFGVPAAARPAIQVQAKGNPLRLRLAAGLVANGARPSTAAVTGALTDAQLYRTLLSRVADPTLRAVLRPGLLVRRLNADLFAAVLIPAAGPRRIDAAEVPPLFDLLTAQQWLLRPMSDAPGWWRQDEVVRPLIVELLKGARGKARLHRLAAAWLAPRPETWAKADGLYHALFGRAGDTLPIDRQLAAQFDGPMMAELPSDRRERVRVARGDAAASTDIQARPGRPA